MANEVIRSGLEAHVEMIARLRAELVPAIEQAAGVLVRCIEAGGKILLCGNGGSAADSQHIAAELVGRFARERRALPAIALTTDTSALTALGNDYGFEKVFARQVEALGRKGDVLIAISTSGNSPNILEAVAMARKMGLTVIGFGGKKGGKLRELVDLPLVVPVDDVARIQEGHILIGHLLSAALEAAI